MLGEQVARDVIRFAGDFAGSRAQEIEHRTAGGVSVPAMPQLAGRIARAFPIA